MNRMRIRPASPRAVRELVAAAVPGLAERMMVARVRREWTAAVGPELAPSTFPLDLDHGTLSVGAETSAGLHELTLRAPDILAALASRFGDVVTAVRPCLRRRTAEPSTPAAPDPPPSEAMLTPAEAETITRLVTPIADPAVAAAARRVLVKDYLARRPRLARPLESSSGRRPGPPESS
jgi:hypothetical protein